MARAFVFPDINDRSPNCPVHLVSPEQVLGWYNQNNKKEQLRQININVKNWYIKEAKNRGWHKVTFIGHQCLLEMVFK